jgi:hypothetical protein
MSYIGNDSSIQIDLKYTNTLITKDNKNFARNLEFMIKKLNFKKIEDKKIENHFLYFQKNLIVVPMQSFRPLYLIQKTLGLK